MNISTPGSLKECLFAVLKNRLLLRVLDETPNTEFHATIMREARESANVAGMTEFPLLLFPCLFEERTSAARELLQRRATAWERVLCSEQAGALSIR